jgi:hypothetical protein
MQVEPTPDRSSYPFDSRCPTPIERGSYRAGCAVQDGSDRPALGNPAAR